MSEADKMFEELGYKKEIDTTLIEGSKLTIYHKNCYYTSITFRESKELGSGYWSISIMPSSEKQETLNKTYEAINKKCLELRMDRGVINNK